MKTETAAFTLLMMDLRTIEITLRRIKRYQVNPKIQKLIEKKFEKIVPMCDYIQECQKELNEASVNCLK